MLLLLLLSISQVTKTCADILGEELALRLSAQLMSGVVRVYALKCSGLEKKAQETSNDLRKKMLNIGSAHTLPAHLQTASEGAITLQDTQSEYLIVTGDGDNPADLEDLDFDPTNWTISSTELARKSVSAQDKSAVTLQDQDQDLGGGFDFDGDGGFDDLQGGGGGLDDFGDDQQGMPEPGGFQLEDDPMDDGMIEFSMTNDNRIDDDNAAFNDKENSDPRGTYTPVPSCAPSAVDSSAFITKTPTASSTKKRKKRSSKEPTIDKETQLSTDQMRLNLEETSDILAPYQPATVETYEEKQRRNDRDFHAPIYPALNEDFAALRRRLMPKSLEDEDIDKIDDVELPRSQEDDEEDLDLLNGSAKKSRRMSSLAGRTSTAPDFENEDGIDQSGIEMDDRTSFGDDFGNDAGDDVFSNSMNGGGGGLSPTREEVEDPDGIYDAQGSPVSSFPSMFSETDPSQSASQSQTYSEGMTKTMGAVASLVEDSGDSGVDFVRIAENIGSQRPANRLVAARTFSDVLFMATKNKIAVQQNKAYGPIYVSLPASAAA